MSYMIGLTKPRHIQKPKQRQNNIIWMTYYWQAVIINLIMVIIKVASLVIQEFDISSICNQYYQDDHGGSLVTLAWSWHICHQYWIWTAGSYTMCFVMLDMWMIQLNTSK